MMLVLALTLLLQEHAFQWSAETDQDYWRAVHLLEVQNDSAAAARLFQELADRPDVTAAPGQAAYLLARAYRAWVEGGRYAEAERLIEPIQRGAQGSDLAEEIAALLQEAEALRRGPGDLDPDFLQLVRDQIGDGGKYRSLARYGRRLLPYSLHLLEEIGRPNEWFPDFAENRKERVHRLLEVSLPSADSSFLAALDRLAAPFLGVELETYFGNIFRSLQPDGAETGELWAAMLVAWSKHQDISRARLAAEWMSRSRALRASPAVNARLAEVLSSEASLLAPLVVESMEWDQVDRYLNELLLAGARSPQPTVRSYAREKLAYYTRTSILVELAPDWTLEDRLHLANHVLLFTKTNASQYGSVSYQGVNYSLGTYWTPSILAKCTANPAEYSNYRAYPGWTLSFEQALALLPALVRDPDPGVRGIAAVAVAHHGVWELFPEAWQAADRQIREWMVQAISQDFPAELDELLAGAVDDSLLGFLAGQVLLRHPERLSYDQASRAARLLPQGRWDNVFSTWQKDEEKRPWLRELGVEASIDAALRLRLLMAWASPRAQEIVASERVTPRDLEGFIELGKLAKEWRASHSFDSFEPLLVQGPRECAEIVRQVFRGPRDVVSFQELLDFPGNSPYLAELFQHFLEVTEDDGLLGSYWIESARREDQAFKIAALMLDSGDRRLARSALGRLAQLPGRSPGFLEEQIAAYLKDPELAAQAALALILVPTAADRVPALREALQLSGLRQRDGLLRVLGRTMDERVVPDLLAALSDPDDAVATAAAEALERLRRAREQRQAWEAWQLYGSGPSPAAALLSKLHSDKLEVRIAAVQSLGTLQAKEALPLLVDLLEDPNPRIAEAAAQALAKINQ